MGQESELKYRDTSTQQTLGAVNKTGMRVIYIRDASDRIFQAYEAPVDAAIGDPCLRTTLKYADGAGGTSRSVVAFFEETVAWPGYELITPGAENDITLVP